MIKNYQVYEPHTVSMYCDCVHNMFITVFHTSDSSVCENVHFDCFAPNIQSMVFRFSVTISVYGQLLYLPGSCVDYFNYLILTFQIKFQKSLTTRLVTPNHELYKVLTVQEHNQYSTNILSSISVFPSLILYFFHVELKENTIVSIFSNLRYCVCCKMFGDEHTVNPVGTWILKSVHHNVVVYFYGDNRNIVWLLNTVFHPKSSPVQEAKYYRPMQNHYILEFYKHLKKVAVVHSVPTANYWKF
jgi:hypothetical protein